jgi:hypothetical protein
LNSLLLRCRTAVLPSTRLSTRLFQPSSLCPNHNLLSSNSHPCLNESPPCASSKKNTSPYRLCSSSRNAVLSRLLSTPPVLGVPTSASLHAHHIRKLLERRRWSRGAVCRAIIRILLIATAQAPAGPLLRRRRRLCIESIYRLIRRRGMCDGRTREADVQGRYFDNWMITAASELIFFG